MLPIQTLSSAILAGLGFTSATGAIMNFLLLMAIPALIVWAVLVYRRGYLRPLMPLVTMPNLLVIVLISGCCLGHELYHRSVGPIPLTIDRLLWAAMLGLFGWLIFKNKIKFSALNHIDYCILGLLGLIAISTFSHDWRYRDNEPIGRLLFFNLMPVGFYLVARNLKFSEKDLRRVFWIFSFFGIYLAITAIGEIKEWSFLVWPKYIADPNEFEFLGRARGPMMNPVANGMVLLLALSSTLILWPRDAAKKLERGYVVGAALLITVGAVATMTRSVWICLPIVYFAFAWIPASQRLRGVMVITATVSVALILGGFGNRLNSFQRDKHVSAAEMSESLSLRPMLANVAWEMFQDRPVFGCGFGQYTKAKRVYHLDSKSGMPLQKVMPYMQHNIVLSYLTELGIIGVGLLIFLVLSLVAISIRLARVPCRQTADGIMLEQNWMQRMAALLLMVMMVSWLVNGMFHDVSIIPMIGSFMYFLFGLVNGTYCREFRAATQPSAASPTATVSTKVAIG